MSHRISRAHVFVIALVLAGVVITFRSFFEATIIQPLALSLWALWRVLASVDMHLYWALAILGVAIQLLRLALPGTPDQRRSAYEEEAPAPGRITRWKNMLQQWPREEPPGALESNLTSMLQYVVQDVEGPDHLAPRRVAVSLDSLPAQARRLLQINQETADLATRPRLSRGKSLLTGWLWRVIFRQKADQKWIEQTLTWMEVELDIHEDNNTRNQD